jgi:hypothetical protein
VVNPSPQRQIAIRPNAVSAIAVVQAETGHMGGRKFGECLVIGRDKCRFRQRNAESSI